MNENIQATAATYPTVEMLGVKIHVIDRAGVFGTIIRSVETGRGGFINNVNVHAMNLAYRDADFRAILNASDLVFRDGAGIWVGAAIAGVKVGERLAPADWVDDLFELCVARGWAVFHLGDTEQVGDDFRRKLAREHPNCRLAGCHHGFFQKAGPENDAVVEMINASGAKVLLVGMSMPIQEKWAWANRDRLQPPVILAVGGLVRVYTGHIKRGPPWMTQNGLEWLYRLAMQSRYTWRRYLIGNPLFLWRVFLSRFGLGAPSPKTGATEPPSGLGSGNATYPEH